MKVKNKISAKWQSMKVAQKKREIELQEIARKNRIALAAGYELDREYLKRMQRDGS